MKIKIPIDQEKLKALCKRYYIRKLALFGSVLREDFGPDSDVDVLVEFEGGHTPGFGFFRIQRELSDVFDKKVDLHTIRFLSRHFRDEVVAQAEICYVAA